MTVGEGGARHREVEARLESVEADLSDTLLEALLVALVLVPGSYSRNRFERLYRVPAVRQIRRRAFMVRSIVGDLVHGVGGARAEFVTLAAAPDGGATLRYRVPAVGLSRTSRLSPRELSLVQFAVDRARRIPPTGGAPWRLAEGVERLAAPSPTVAAQLGKVLAQLPDTALLAR